MTRLANAPNGVRSHTLTRPSPASVTRATAASSVRSTRRRRARRSSRSAGPGNESSCSDVACTLTPVDRQELAEVIALLPAQAPGTLGGEVERRDRGFARDLRRCGVRCGAAADLVPGAEQRAANLLAPHPDPDRAVGVLDLPAVPDRQVG